LSTQTNPRPRAHAHFGKKFVRYGATRISATASSSPLNVTAFENTDKSTAVQIINNSNNTETVTLSLKGYNKHSQVTTYLTNQQNDLKAGVATKKGGKVSAKVPGQSLLSFCVS
jgi:hypothetical protein